MKHKRLKDMEWFPYAVAACIAVILYVLLAHLSSIVKYIRHFINFFRPVIIGVILAYVVNPLANLFKTRVFGRIKREKLKTVLSNLSAFLLVVLFLVFILALMIPQLIESINLLADNLETYMDSLIGFFSRFGFSLDSLKVDSIISSSENMINGIISYIEDNLSTILSTSVSTAKEVAEWIIAFILSIYFLAEKEHLKSGVSHLFKVIFGEKKYVRSAAFIKRCDVICSRYIVYNVLDSLIIGVVNAIFMSIAGMQYIGLISFIVAVFNLIPSFGPIIGAALGGFILLMVKPSHALIFLIFTLTLQTVDGYVLKPMLFGNSLGISGLWILIAIVVGGRMFGLAGILLAIPAIAVIDILYREYLMPWLERRNVSDGYEDITEDLSGDPPEAPPEEI